MGDIKLMPQAQEAEKVLLGTLLNDSSLYDKVSNYLSDDAFYDGNHSLGVLQFDDCWRRFRRIPYAPYQLDPGRRSACP